MVNGKMPIYEYSIPQKLIKRKEKVMNRNVPRISRRARLLAQQNHIDLSKIIPTGPDGRIIERDILRELEKNYLAEIAETSADVLNADTAEDSVTEKDSAEEIFKTETVEETPVAETVQPEVAEESMTENIAKREERMDSEEPVEKNPVDKSAESEMVEDSFDEKLSEPEEPEIEIEWVEIEAEPTAIVAAPVNTVTKELNEKETNSKTSEKEKETTQSYGTEAYRHTDVIIPRTETAPNGHPITVTMSFDAGEIVKLHTMIKENGEMMGVPHITINDMILFATAKLLKKNKALNAHFLGDKIRYFDGAHIGFFVDTDHGIENLTVFDADRLSLSGLSKITSALIRGARAGKVSSEKNKPCASFMVSNLGTLGVESFTPILKEPQTGILGVGALQRRIKDVNGKDIAYSCIPLSLTFDPRALGTTSASKFLRDLCVSLENFELLLLK